MNKEAELRKSLDEMMTAETQTVFEQRFEEIKKRFAPRIHILSESRDRLRTYNCFAYALNIASLPRYQKLVKEYDKSALADSSFVSHVLSRNWLEEITEQDALPGSIILYYKDGVLKHGGKISNIRMVHSKWGPNELFEHGFWEVPASYGDKIKFYRPENAEKIIDLLETYCFDCHHK